MAAAPLQVMKALEPGTLVHGFFLTPDDIGEVWDTDPSGRCRAPAGTIELLDANNGDMVQLALAAGFQQIVKDLAAAGYQPGDSGRIVRIDLRDDLLEAALGQSSSVFTANRCRNRLFGLITISGLRKARFICRRNM